MGKIFEKITPELKEWIAKQKMFFVATAPLSEKGLVNCSPKGLDSFRVLDDTTVAYQDLTGSGVETIAHIKENKRIVIMFCAFEGPPNIVRIHGEGEVVEPDDKRFAELEEQFPKHNGTRAFIIVHAKRISDSCGYSVPVYEFKNDRDVLDKWVDRKGTDGVKQYQKEKNLESLDGLAGLKESNF